MTLPLTISQWHREFVTYLERHGSAAALGPTIEIGLEEFLTARGVSPDQIKEIKTKILSRMFGLGALEPLLADNSISEIMVNGPESVWIERAGKLERTEIVFSNAEEIVELVNRLVGRVGRRLDAATPMVDARLPDGSRLNAVISPLSRLGPVVTIRRFPANVFTLDQAIISGALSLGMAKFLSAAVKARQNILIAGATGSGKTSLLNALAAKIPARERIITIEDTAEIKLKHPHTVELEARQPNIENQGAISIRALLKNALRMRPDRIIVGEVRGPEALDMLQAMNTGHRGSITTVHANSPDDALERLITMALMADVGLPERAVRQQVLGAIAFVVYVARYSDGSRRVASISEVKSQLASSAGNYTRPLFWFRPLERDFVSGQQLPERTGECEAEGFPLDIDWFK